MPEHKSESFYHFLKAVRGETASRETSGDPVESVLRTLADHRGAAAMPRLMDDVDLSVGELVRTLDAMTELGLVETSQTRSTGGKQVRLTASGEKAARKATGAAG